MLLYSQEIAGNEQVEATSLDDFYRQEANTRTPLIPWAPYVSIYYLGENFYNRDKIRRKRDRTEEKLNEKISKAQEKGRDRRAARLQAKKESKLDKFDKVLDEGNLLMRIGEPIAVYDSAMAGESATQMEAYLHSKGFFHGEVDYDADTAGRKVTVTYTIQEKTPYKVDSSWLRVSSQPLRMLLQENEEESLIDVGENYDQDALKAERNRINELLRNNGYYEFSQQYVEFNVDSTQGDHKVTIETEILRPANRGYHKQFTIDSVVFTTDATARGDLQGRNTRNYRGLTYRFFDEKYSKKVLSNRVFIHPDSLYSRQNTLETQKQLANLDNFKFINIDYDTANGKFISYIYTSPLKKFQTNNEIGFTYTSGIPGPYFNTSWTARNVFGGLENMEFNFRVGSEGVPPVILEDGANNAFIASQQLSANVSLIFPQFAAPFSDELRNKFGRLNPKTRALVGYAFTNRQNEFSRTTYNTSLSYSWQTERTRKKDFHNHLFTITPLDISLINTSFAGDNETNAFFRQVQEWREEGNPYFYSFTNSFVSSIYAFAVLNKNNYGTYTQRSRYMRPFIESGGTTQNFVSFNFLTDNPNDPEKLRGFKYLKFSNDYRQYLPLKQPKAGIAWRINAGVGIPYGDDFQVLNGENEVERTVPPTLPYEKFFFAGGSNSIRAFRPRRLGPGGYTPGIGEPAPDFIENVALGNGFTNNIEVPGEVLIEGSIEYRHNIFGFLNGALFLDAGNVWLLRQRDAYPEGEFQLNEFYRQIALGTGYGFRLDFSFLIVRLDLGLKLYNPQSTSAVDEEGIPILGERDYARGWVWNSNYGSKPLLRAQGQNDNLWSQDLIILNIGIGYPF